MSTASPQSYETQDLLGFKNLAGLIRDLSLMILWITLNLMAVKLSLGTRENGEFIK
jgi:hypothetical protein